MSGSFTRIDYSLRPAKHAERRMLCDVFRRLRPFGRVEDYVYVGFGSVWFADFTLFHRALGIKKMISIEKEAEAKQRFEDNKPFRIDVEYKISQQVLPSLDWDKNQFLWLDYDDPLSTEMLQDVRTVASRARAGTALAVTVQCMRAPQLVLAQRDTSRMTDAMTLFKTVFGRERVPNGTSEDDLSGWPFGSLSRTLLLQEIQAELAVRNSAGGSKMLFETLSLIEYEDGAKMTTLVGVFHSDSAGDMEKLKDCHFEALDFGPAEGGPVRIAIPKLTSREFRRLESQLPLKDGAELSLGSIPKTDANSFVKMYRYLPNFAVLEG